MAITFLYTVILTQGAGAALYDRVVASVDDYAITLSQFQKQYARTKEVRPDITREEVLTTMVNRVLLLREARKYRIEASSPEEIVREFIDLKVRAFLRVSEQDVEDYYRQNEGRFEGKDIDQVREEIERYLTEKRLNERLKDLLSELRRSAYIRIQLQPE